jgi:hypothetical protein
MRFEDVLARWRGNPVPPMTDEQWQIEAAQTFVAKTYTHCRARPYPSEEARWAAVRQIVGEEVWALYQLARQAERDGEGREGNRFAPRLSQDDPASQSR